MISTMDNPQLEFAFAIRLQFTRTSMVPDIPTGGWRRLLPTNRHRTACNASSAAS